MGRVTSHRSEDPVEEILKQDVVGVDIHNVVACPYAEVTKINETQHQKEQSQKRLKAYLVQCFFVLGETFKVQFPLYSSLVTDETHGVEV